MVLACSGGSSLNTNVAPSSAPADQALNLGTMNVLAQLAGQSYGASKRVARAQACQSNTTAAQKAGVSLASTSAAQKVIQTSAWKPWSDAITNYVGCQSKQAAAVAADPNSVVQEFNTVTSPVATPAPELSSTPIQNPESTPKPESTPAANDCLSTCLSSDSIQSQELANAPQAVEDHLAPGLQSLGVAPDAIAVCFAYCNINETAEFGGAVFTGQQSTSPCAATYQAVLAGDVQVEGTPAFQDLRNSAEWSSFVSALQSTQNCSGQ